MPVLNKLVEEQLNKVQYADLSAYVGPDHSFIIPRNVTIKLAPDHSYLIELDSALLTPGGNRVLETNWNGGRLPKYTYYKIDVVALLGGMVKCMGIGTTAAGNEDFPEIWSGYFPIKQIKILQELN